MDDKQILNNWYESYYKLSQYSAIGFIQNMFDEANQIEPFESLVFSLKWGGREDLVESLISVGESENLDYFFGAERAAEIHQEIFSDNRSANVKTELLEEMASLLESIIGHAWGFDVVLIATKHVDTVHNIDEFKIRVENL